VANPVATMPQVPRSTGTGADTLKPVPAETSTVRRTVVDQRAIDEEAPHRLTASGANARAAKTIAAMTLPATMRNAGTPHRRGHQRRAGEVREATVAT